MNRIFGREEPEGYPITHRTKTLFTSSRRWTSEPGKRTKSTLPVFIEKICFKRYGRECPLDVKSIKEVLRAKEKKKEERRKEEQPKHSELDNRRSRPC